jgi:hypothetical protein
METSFNPFATGPVFGTPEKGNKTFSSSHSTIIVRARFGVLEICIMFIQPEIFYWKHLGGL